MKTIRTTHVPCFRRWSRKGYAVFASLHRHVTIGVLSVGMSIILLATPRASAQTVDTAAVYRSLRIDTVAITGAKQGPMRSVMSQTPVFDRSREGAAPIQTLESALRLSPAIDLRERGGKGVQADISIRGGTFDQTMVMLNGINFTDARTGHQSHSLPVDMESIGSIELIDGVTGTGAYAGAIDIRTRPLHPRYLRAEASAGAHGYAYGSLSGACRSKRLSLLGAASLRRSDGYRPNTDFRNWNAYLRAQYESPHGGLLDLQAGYQNRLFGANGFYSSAYPDQREHTSTALGSVRWVRSFGALGLHASAGYRKNFDRFELVKGHPKTVPYNYHNTDNVTAEAWAEYRWRGGTSSVGGNYAYHHIYSTVLGSEMEHPRRVPGTDARYTHATGRHTGDVWLRHSLRLERFDAAASIGASVNPYGTRLLWNAAAGYTPLRGLRLEAGAARSMRLPTFTDLYYTAQGYVSNPHLVPEKAVTWRLGATLKRGAWHAATTCHYRSGRDIIDWVRPAGEQEWHSLQITRLHTFGAELSVGYASNEGVLRQAALRYGYLSSNKSSPAGESSYSLDYMRHKAGATLALCFLKRFTLGLTATAYDRNGSYVDAAGKQRDYGLHLLVDARLSWEKGAVQLYAEGTNLTATRYCDFAGLPMPRRWLSGGAVLTLGKGH